MSTNLNLIDKEIQRLIKELKESDNKLEYLSSVEYKIELFRNAHLHLDLRKYTYLANQDEGVYYCSICGEKFNNRRYRIIHVAEDHQKGKML